MGPHMDLYCLQTKFVKVMFLQESVSPRGGVYPIPCWDTPSWADLTNPWADAALSEHTTLWADNPLGRQPPG